MSAPVNPLLTGPRPPAKPAMTAWVLPARAPGKGFLLYIRGTWGNRWFKFEKMAQIWAEDINKVAEDERQRAATIVIEEARDAANGHGKLCQDCSETARNLGEVAAKKIMEGA